MLAARLALPLVLLAVLPSSRAGSGAIPPSPAGWERTLSVPAIDPTQGLPSAVRLRFERCTVARAGLENLGDVPCEVAFSYAVVTRLGLPDGTVLAERSRSGYEAADLLEFDGERDADGPSGTVLGWRGMESETLVVEDPKVIEQFVRVGGGTVDLPVETFGACDVEALGCVAHDLELLAGVRVTVTYVP